MKQCKHCDKQFDRGAQVAGHQVWCKKNPQRELSVAKIAAMQRGTKLSDEHRARITATVTEKLRKGEWHYSFSKRRTHEYRGMRFHGTWELRYAQWLDENKIHWRKPTEMFPYEWKGKLRQYLPDFYLIDEDCYIEVKGYETERDRAKWSQFPHKHRVLRGKELNDLGIKVEYKIIVR